MPETCNTDGVALPLPYADDRDDKTEEMTPLFPMFVNLAGCGVLIIGAGRVAYRKAVTLLACGAVLRVAAPQISGDFERLARSDTCGGRIELLRRSYGCDLLREPVLGSHPTVMLVAASGERHVNREAGSIAREHGIYVNVADSPEESTFFFPAFINSGGFVAGISSSGRSPSACRMIADDLRPLWGGLVESALEKNGSPKPAAGGWNG